MLYNYINWDNKTLKIGIYSMYYNSVKKEFIEYQKKIFDKFNININQVEWSNEGYPGHSNFLNHIARTEEVDYFIFFDIDSIPLRKDFIEIVLERIYGKNTILGPEQITSHLSNEVTKGPFAAPSCFCISKEFYKILGEPSFEATYRGDVAQELTHICREQGYQVQFIKFNYSKEKVWTLRDDVMYGPGTVYEDLIYHNFNSLSGHTVNYFIEKAKEILYYLELKEFVTKIFYINLDSRPDRDEDTIKELIKYDLYDISERVTAEIGSDKPTFEYGSDEFKKNVDAITRSHLKCIEKAKELDLEQVLILEDDIVFLPIESNDPIHIINNSINDIKKLDDWEILYLGGTLHQEEIVLESPFLMHVNTILGTHAYIIHKRAYNKVLSFYEYGVPVDLMLLGLTNKYSTFPGPTGQRMGSRDNNGKNSPNINPYGLYVRSYLDKPIVKKYLNETTLVNFDYTKIRNLDITRCLTHIKNENEINHFLSDPGVEHYRLLAFLSSKYNDIDIIDIGSFTGVSAVALSYNSKNRVHSFDISDRIDLLSVPPNVMFYKDNILGTKYECLIKNAGLIMIDVNHNGEDEKLMTDHIIKCGYKGYIVYDDIKLNDEMISFFNTLSGKKMDISNVGHWSGTGILQVI